MSVIVSYAITSDGPGVLDNSHTVSETDSAVLSNGLTINLRDAFESPIGSMYYYDLTVHADLRDDGLNRTLTTSEVGYVSDAGDTFWNQEVVAGENGGFTLFLQENSDVYAFSYHATRLFKGDGADNTFVADDLYETFKGGGGSDTVSYANSAAAVQVDLSTTAAQQSGGDAAGDSLSGVSNVIGSKYADTLTGSSGSNLLVGGRGADIIYGGGGSDTVSYAGSNAGVTIDLNSTHAQGGGGDGKGDVLTSIENLIGSSFNDRLYGDARSNSLTGGAGADLLIGGAGNDRLAGGSGHDTLEGGAGNNIFVFNSVSAADRDTVTDFSHGSDKIELIHTAFAGLAAGKLPVFAIGTRATTTADHLFYNPANGYLYYDQDGSGARKPELFAVLDKGPHLTAGDFKVV